jgi:hypothetical protein
MNTKLTIPAMITAGLLQACAGGQITDASGNGVTGSGNANLVVNFQANNGQSFATGVDSNGTFGFDTYAPKSATNNPVVLLGNPFVVSISSKDGTSGQASLPFNVTYVNASCPDHYTGANDKNCALFQVEEFGTSVGTPGAAYQNPFYDLTSTVVPVSTQQWCAQALAGFGVANEAARYNDIMVQISSAMPNVAWGWTVVKVTPSAYTPPGVKIDAYGTIPANFSGGWANGENGGYIDIAQHFQGPDYYVYPDTTYTVAFIPGGLGSKCNAKLVNFQTTYDTVPTCVIDHDCPVDPGSADGNGQGDCNPGVDCCAGGYCTDPGCSPIVGDCD